MSTCAHRICRTTEPCRYGDPNAPETVHPLPEDIDRKGPEEDYHALSQTGAWQVEEMES